MKNLFYLAAIAATAVGFTSCSSDEDLNDAVKDSGIPFKVTASAPTRATDVTSSNFANFQLYGFEGTNEWIAGKQYTYSSSAWAPAITSSTYKWPTANTTSNFYAVSENAASMSSAFVDDIKNSQSFTYTVPTTIADQKDLLVATATGKSTDASVALAFQHALASAKLTISLNPGYSESYGPTATTDYRLAIRINSISIHNIKTTGKYNYSTSKWSDQATYGTYTINFSTPLMIETDQKETKKVTIDIDGSNGKLMLLPQSITPWDIAANSTDAAVLVAGPQSNESYIAIDCITMAYEPGKVVTACEKLKTAGTFTTDGSGNYLAADGTEIATSDGIVKVYNNTNLNDKAFPTIENYNLAQTDNLLNRFDEFVNNDFSAPMYKPFKLSNANDELLTNYTHNITLEIVNAARLDGAGAYGNGATPTTAKMR